MSNTVTDLTNGAGSVISDDTDPDSDPLTVGAISFGGAAPYAVSAGTDRTNGTSITGNFGTLKIGADGTYSYVAGSSAGSDVFTYTLADGNGGVDTATLTFTSTPNNAPTAVDDTINVTVGTPATGNVVTANDTDPDSDPLTVSAIAGGSVGSAITGTYGDFTSKL